MMSVKKKLLLAAVLLLDAAGLVFLCLSIFGNEPGTRYLAIALWRHSPGGDPAVAAHFRMDRRADA